MNTNFDLDKPVSLLGRSLPLRLTLIIGGVGAWLAVMLVRCGMSAVQALGDAVLMAAGLLLITSTTRSVSLKTLSSLFLRGAFTMGLTVLVGNVVPRGDARGLIIPPIEQILWMLPPLLVLWRWRHRNLWSIGASDVLLMMFASGLGYEVVENAYMRAANQWSSTPLILLPTSILAGDRIHGEFLKNGHALWSALVGASIGIGLVYRHNRPFALIISTIGILAALFDHVAVNAHNTALHVLTGNGYLCAILALVMIGAAILVDSIVLRGITDNFKQYIESAKGKRTLERRLYQRSFVYADWYSSRAESASAQTAREAALWLLYQQSQTGAPPPPAAHD